MIEVTTIGEGREFEDVDYSDEEEGIEKLNDAKGNFILLLDLLLHLKILHKLPLLLKIYHPHNLLSIILLHIVIIQSHPHSPLFKI
jgi:hypothetical protein